MYCFSFLFQNFLSFSGIFYGSGPLWESAIKVCDVASELLEVSVTQAHVPCTTPQLSLASPTLLPSRGTLPCSRGATTPSPAVLVFLFLVPRGAFWRFLIDAQGRRPIDGVSARLPCLPCCDTRRRCSSSSPWQQCRLNSGTRTRQLWEAPGPHRCQGEQWRTMWPWAGNHWRGCESALEGAVVSPVGGTEIETWLLCERLWGWACCFGVWVKSVMSCEISLEKEGFHPSTMCLLAYKRHQRWHVSAVCC